MKPPVLYFHKRVFASGAGLSVEPVRRRSYMNDGQEYWLSSTLDDAVCVNTGMNTRETITKIKRRDIVSGSLLYFIFLFLFVLIMILANENEAPLLGNKVFGC